MSGNECSVEEIQFDVVEEEVFGLGDEPGNAPTLSVQRQVHHWDELRDARVEVLEVAESSHEGTRGDGEEKWEGSGP